MRYTRDLIGGSYSVYYPKIEDDFYSRFYGNTSRPNIKLIPVIYNKNLGTSWACCLHLLNLLVFGLKPKGFRCNIIIVT